MCVTDGSKLMSWAGAPLRLERGSAVITLQQVSKGVDRTFPPDRSRASALGFASEQSCAMVTDRWHHQLTERGLLLSCQSRQERSGSRHM